MTDHAALSAAVPGLPELDEILTTPRGTTVPGFRVRGTESLDRMTLPAGLDVLAARAGDEEDEEVEDDGESGEEGTWSPDAPRPGHLLPVLAGEAPLVLALVPAVGGWQVPAVLHYGGWNDYPAPADHAAILRHWERRYGAELVVLTGTTTELAIAQPPLTRADALELARQFSAYNDGEYDYYDAEDLTDLASSLLGAEVWLAWWD